MFMFFSINLVKDREVWPKTKLNDLQFQMEGEYCFNFMCAYLIDAS
jgi:hypothetical protein